MSSLKRRQFLRFTSSVLATLGLSQLDIQQQSLRYGKVLAQSTSRKLALLVGINKYPQNQRGFSDLQGCVNDVELQQQLLIHRFGFNPKDIKILTDAQANRNGILTAFQEHLINQAKPGDVVVFHFSGHGSRVVDPEPITADGLNSTLVPVDESPLYQQGIVNDIMGKTLFLLMSALARKTDQVTVVLDSCFSGGGTRGNIRVRSLPGGRKWNAGQEELQEQQKWLTELQLSPQELLEARRQGIATGVAIASAKPHQYALDYHFSGFYAGAFTYLLTQNLWQQTGAIRRVIERVNGNIKLISTKQIPQLEAQPNSGNQEKPMYFLEQEIIPAEAVISELNGNRAQLWLGGIPLDSIDAFGQGASFVILSASEGESTKVDLVSRNGLIGEALVTGEARQGDLLQELSRAIPSDWRLNIGLDPSLGKEVTQAKQAIQKLERLEAIVAQSGSQPYSQEVHYILSRMTAAYRQQIPTASQEIIPVGSIGLFSPALELIPQSFKQAVETVPEAISRLSIKFKSLLAARIIKMTLNAQSSRLNLKVIMGLEGKGNRRIAQAFTPRGCRQGNGKCASTSPWSPGQRLIQKLSVGEPIQFQVTNQEERVLYLSIILIDPSEGLIVWFPNEFQRNSAANPEQFTRIEPKQTRLIPDPSQDDFVIVTEKTGLGEVLVIASHKPLTQALLRLRNLSRGPIRGDDSVNVVSDLLNDLSVSRSGIVPKQRIQTSEIAAFSLQFEVISN
ncbi:MAG: DUF4384 domain-containing protein [Symploca sp. SIO2B6]|nr:DUF4384 domain-containing protein [Symploca sp. SIO2B6]